MIIKCQQCHTVFNLDENLLKRSGSKVRCSVCKHTFTAFPPEEESEVKEFSTKGTENGEIISQRESDKAGDTVTDADKTVIMETLEESEQGKEAELEAISFEDISQLESTFMDDKDEEDIGGDIDKAMDRAEKVEKKIITRDEKKKSEGIEERRKPVEPQPIMKKRHRSILWIILLVLVLLLGGGTVLYLLKPNLLWEYFPSFKKILPKEQVFDMGNKRLSIQRDRASLKGFFVDSQKAGKLFVVKGLITNNYPDTRNFIRVRSDILDSKGKVVKSKIIYAGNLISDEELVTLSMMEINNRLMNKFGKDNVNKDIAPDASIPFMIAFGDLPKDVSEFTVEPISSFPAEE
jgi:pilus assembly protein FimV